MGRRYSIAVILLCTPVLLTCGKPLPKKTKREGNEFFKARLTEMVSGVAEHPEPINHDLCDALFGAYTAFLGSLGRARMIGDEGEGRILEPLAP